MRHAVGHILHHLTEIRSTIHTHTWETTIHAIEAISPIIHSWDGPIHSYPLIVKLFLLLLLSFLFLGFLLAWVLIGFLSLTGGRIRLEAFSVLSSLIATLNRLAGSIAMERMGSLPQSKVVGCLSVPRQEHAAPQALVLRQRRMMLRMLQ